MSDPERPVWRPRNHNPHPDFACRECGVEFYGSRLVTFRSDSENKPIWECPNCGSVNLERLR